MRLVLGIAVFSFTAVCVPLCSHAQDSDDLRSELEQLRRANALLEQRLADQDRLVRRLIERVEGLEDSASRDSDDSDSETAARAAGRTSGWNFGNVHLSGTAALAFFDTQSRGFAPNAEFRVDEARLFVETPVWNDVYSFAELNLAQREHEGLDLQLGELYVDFENVSSLWGKNRQLNIRAGRMDIPFGEEYLTRDAIDNPLISHSLTDFWGIDEGVELYGSIGPASYVVAVQNGGVPGTRDFDADKSVAGRVAFDPLHWLHLSVSAMRTGDLHAQNDYLSELWFGNAWFRSIGSTNTTTFDATLVEADLKIKWNSGHAAAFGGLIWYDDNDPAADNSRQIWFVSVESVQRLTRALYAAARFSHINAPDGYPIAAHGDIGRQFFGPSLTEEMWRLSFGFGYRFSENLVLKSEYSIDWGEQTSGANRSGENLLAVQAAMKF